MSQYAESYFRRDTRLVGRTRIGPRIRIIPTLMVAGIVVMVALALIEEARMTPEQRLALFESSYVAYP
jgi:hypothetical protein